MRTTRCWYWGLTLGIWVCAAVSGCSESGGGSQESGTGDDTETSSATTSRPGETTGETDSTSTMASDSAADTTDSDMHPDTVSESGKDTETSKDTGTGVDTEGSDVEPGSGFENAFGGDDYDDGKDIAQTMDGGFLATGYTMSFVTDIVDINDPSFLVTNSDVLLVRLDAAGQPQGHVSFGGKYPDSGESIIPAGDGSFFVAGSTTLVVGQVEVEGQPFDKIRSDGLLLKVDDTGAVQWHKHYGNPDVDEEFKQLIPTSDGNFLAVGKAAIHKAGMEGEPYIGMPNTSTSRLAGYAVKFTANGDELWSQEFGGPSEKWDFCRGVAEIDAGYLAVGGTSSFESGTLDFYAALLDKDTGEPIWQYHYRGDGGSAAEDYANAVVATQDGSGAIIVGVENRNYDYYSMTLSGKVRAIRLDENGDLVDEAVYSYSSAGKGIDEGMDVIQSPLGGYVVLASVRYDLYFQEYEESDVEFIGIDDNLDVQWATSHGTFKQYDFPERVHPTQAGGLIAVGSTTSFLAPSADYADDFYFLKTGAQGR